MNLNRTWVEVNDEKLERLCASWYKSRRDIDPQVLADRRVAEITAFYQQKWRGKMGLDSFWRIMGKDEHGKDAMVQNTAVKFDRELRLCGGMFSGHGDQSFRGKVYEQVINDLTDGELTLYVEEMPNEDVQTIARELEEMGPDKLAEKYEGTFGKQEAIDFIEMWSRHAEGGSVLHGWW